MHPHYCRSADARICTQIARPVKKCRFLLANVYCKTLTSKYPRFGKVYETAKKEKNLPVAKLKNVFGKLSLD